VHQFLIVLANTEPVVWRRIQVPQRYSFWDLHVAIQDAMGWQDYHLHEFRVLDLKTGRMVRIGIPDDEFPDERPTMPGWEVRVTPYFDHLHVMAATYVYDFGDDWEHIVVYEGTEPADPSLTYPRCVSGARACPPEDSGGTHGYLEFLEAISDPNHPEHEDVVRWSGGSFDPDKFDPTRCSFDDPKKRWRIAFQSRGA
jgi:hypothetical protein